MNRLASLLLATCFVCLSGSALCAGGDDPTPPRKPADPNITAGRAAIDKKDWKTALDMFSKADQNSADTQNWLGYTNRNLGNFEAAFRHYARALQIDPQHRGAHEYAGEAYLLTNNLPKAEEHLAALDKICFFPCEEFSDLKAKVAEYKKKQPTTAGAR
jgi:tetratricopeptide (TPR) repeat protein